MKKILYGLATVFLLTAQVGAREKSLPRLEISRNGRFFQTSTGQPFFWLGDTGWLLFVKCSREEVIQYLDTRKQQGFNVVQAMLLHEINAACNVYGDSAFVNLNVAQPRVTTGNDAGDPAAYDYWDHVDFVIREAEKRGIYMALVPAWGSNVKSGKISVGQSRIYAQFLAERYKNSGNIIWLNGGDIKGSDGLEIWQSIGNTIKKNDPGHLMTFHPRGRTSSSDWFHNAPWLDFNMFQSGHKTYDQDTSSSESNHYGEDNWKFINVDYNLTPVKPTLDGEPSYENIPHGLHDSLQARWTDADIRRYAYWSVFSGGAGFTYGENAVMQFNKRGDRDANFGVNQNWKASINSPGASQVKYLKDLMLSHSYFDRKPAQNLIVGNAGLRYHHLIATKGKDFAMVYSYTSEKFSVDLSKAGFTVSKAFWFNPSNGERSFAGTMEKQGIADFDPPGNNGNGNDWVLILEN